MQAQAILKIGNSPWIILNIFFGVLFIQFLNAPANFLIRSQIFALFIIYFPFFCELFYEIFVDFFNQVNNSTMVFMLPARAVGLVLVFVIFCTCFIFLWYFSFLTQWCIKIIHIKLRKKKLKKLLSDFKAKIIKELDFKQLIYNMRLLFEFVFTFNFSTNYGFNINSWGRN